MDSSDLDGAILKFVKTSSVTASWNSPSNVHARIYAAEVEVTSGCPANYKLIRVTTLNPTGPGSLYEALTTPGERIVVFEVGGKKTPKNIINKILAYKNTFVLNKKFKEGRSGFFVVFNVVVGFSWFVLLLNSRDVFSNS